MAATTKTGGSVRDRHGQRREGAAEADEAGAGTLDEAARSRTPLQRAQDAVKALEARAQDLQAQEETLLRQRRDLQQAMAQARQAHDLDTLTTLLSQEPALAQLLRQVETDKRETWAAVQGAKAAVQQVYREASPTASRYQTTRARVQALQQAIRHHGQELARCQAELPQHQHQLDALGRELREVWGVEEPT
jgi:chromosome segregation ATPase